MSNTVSCLMGLIRRLCVAAALVAMPVLAQAQASETVAAGQIVRLLVGLGVVVLILLLGAKYFPRIGGARFIGRESFRVVSTLPVGQRERVVIVQLGGEQIVLGVAQGRVNLLHRLDEPLEAPPQEIAPAKFSGPTWLTRVLGGNSQ